MALLEVDRSTCNQCGLCAAVCNLDIINFREKTFPQQLEGTDLRCIRCGHCVAVCPSDSLTHIDIPVGQCPPLEKSLDISFAQAAQLIKGRRSIREFKDKQVPREEIERLIEVARYAPTGGNQQRVQWLVITNPAIIKRLSEIGLEWMRWEIKNAPVLGPIIGGLKGLLKSQESGKDVILQNAPAVIITFGRKNGFMGSIECISAAVCFNLAAVSAGLGCCWNGFLLSAMSSFPAMIEAVALPEGYTPYGCLTIGYPKYRYQRVPTRKPARITYRP